jgi:hypothetical protein
MCELNEKLRRACMKCETHLGFLADAYGSPAIGVCHQYGPMNRSEEGRKHF